MDLPSFPAVIGFGRSQNPLETVIIHESGDGNVALSRACYRPDQPDESLKIEMFYEFPKNNVGGIRPVFRDEVKYDKGLLTWPIEDPLRLMIQKPEEGNQCVAIPIPDHPGFDFSSCGPDVSNEGVSFGPIVLVPLSWGYDVNEKGTLIVTWYMKRFDLWTLDFPEVKHRAAYTVDVSSEGEPIFSKLAIDK